MSEPTEKQRAIDNLRTQFVGLGLEDLLTPEQAERFGDAIYKLYRADVT